MKNKKLAAVDSMILPKLPAYFLFACLLWIGWQLLQVVQPFMMVLIFSAIVATVTYPIYQKLCKWFKNKTGIAAFLTCLVVMFVIVIPLALFLLVLIGEAVNLYKIVSFHVEHFNLADLMKWAPGNYFYDLSGVHHQDVVRFAQDNFDALKNGITESAKYISTFAAKQSAMILTELGLTLFNLLLMFFALYFFYKDGKKILGKLMILSPIPEKYEQELFRKFTEISKATIFGTFMTSIAQGIVAWIGFGIAGVPSSFFWGTAVAICSLVPTIGTGMVWLPMGVFMLITGNPWGLFVLIWGAGLVSTIDNVLRVVFIGNSANLNPLLAFVSVFGGLLAFGLIGVVFGPMLLVLFLTFLHIYELEYSDMLNKPLGKAKKLGLK